MDTKDLIISNEKELYIFDEKAQDELSRLKPWTKEYERIFILEKCTLRKPIFPL